MYVNGTYIHTLQIIGGLSILQETEGQKTNNGIQYRLQLLYANGKYNTYTYLPHRTA